MLALSLIILFSMLGLALLISLGVLLYRYFSYRKEKEAFEFVKKAYYKDATARYWRKKWMKVMLINKPTIQKKTLDKGPSSEKYSYDGSRRSCIQDESKGIDFTLRIGFYTGQFQRETAARDIEYHAHGQGTILIEVDLDKSYSENFKRVKQYTETVIQCIKNQTNDGCYSFSRYSLIYLLGNKSHVEPSERQFSYEEGVKLNDELNATYYQVSGYFECSEATEESIDTFFEYLAKLTFYGTEYSLNPFPSKLRAPPPDNRKGILPSSSKDEVVGEKTLEKTNGFGAHWGL